MTVLTTAATTGLLPGNGATTVFNYAFIIPFLSDGITPAVNVWYKDANGTLNILGPTDFVIDGVGDAAGGTVTFTINGAAIATGTFIQIDRAVPYIQPDSYPNQSFLPESVEAGLDNLEEQIQQIVGGVAVTYVNSPVVLDFRHYGAGSVPSPGVLGDKYIPFPARIVAWTLQADQSGSIELDIWSKLFSEDDPPTVGNSITGANYPKMTAHQQQQSANMTNWSPILSAGSALRFNLRSISTIQNFTLSLTLSRADLPLVGTDPGGGGGGGGGGGSGGSPTGAAGGDLTGTYPNPQIAAGAVTGGKTAAMTLTNGNMATMADGTVKANISGGAAVPSDVTLAALAAALGSSVSSVNGVAQQGLLFSLTGGVYALVSSFPAGAAGPTAIRTATGKVTVTLGTTPLNVGYMMAKANFLAADEGAEVSAPGTLMAASGSVTLNIQHCSSKTYYDAALAFVLFY